MPAGYPIADNLVTESAQQALSAKQGVKLKEMVDNVQPMDYNTWAKACRARMDNLLRTAWAPVASMPKYYQGSVSTFSADVENTGMPYSSTREVDKYVGYNVSLRTFLTALHNPYSMLYTENIASSASASAYGKTYHANECATYMGIQCTAFAGYILGTPTYWLAHEYAYAARMGYYTDLGQPQAANVELFDVIRTSGHVLIISDLKYSGGSLAKIYVSESVSPTPKTTEYTPSSFNTKFDTSSYTLYRATRKGLSLDVENVSDIEYNDDICTIAGDYAVFRAGDTIGVNYTLGSYTKMEIFRNNALVLTKNSMSSSSHLVNLTSDNLPQGLYTARLSNADGTSVSKPTHFEVVDAAVTCSVSNGKASVGMSSQRGVPVYVDFVTIDGYAIARRLLTDEERQLGIAVVDAPELLSVQPNTKGYTLTGCYVKVLFKSEYGIVPSEPILSGY